jgi:MoaA/NifB/PqqE/SkfB family radical SAM enzyme
MNTAPNPWRTAATMRGLQVLEKLWRRIPGEVLLPPLKKWIGTGIRHADGVDFMTLLAVELKRQWSRFAPNVRKRFVENMFGYNMLLAGPRRKSMLNAIGEAPLVMVISPTMRCNLKCVGCYSAHYRKEDAIDTATFDRLLNEAREMGIHFIVVSGGEPYIRPELLDMFTRHQDLLFMTYTNGVVIHRDKLASKLAELGNVMPAISVEGFAGETDARRGKGVYNRIIGAMSALREAGVLFGFSATPMRHNNDLLVSDEFIEFYKNLGCFFGWYFNYMPVGRKPNLELMPTVEQRAYRMDRVREIRQKHSILVSDFWTDGTLCGGCLSSGRVYFHINAQGGVEPCVFHQFYVDNVLDKPLKEALNSPYFQYMRQRLYQSENPLCPCPVSDNPESCATR